jgi:teichuronic acid biosynthesis glycosyltransferase TuaG
MTSNATDPLVSIVTPAYNAARFVAQTIESVLAQTFTDWEMIVVDDRSRADTRAIVDRYAQGDRRIRVDVSPQNQGPGPTRNQAIAMARGRYLAFLDSDDLWDSTKLERQLAFMRGDGHAFTYTAYRTIAEGGAPLGHASAIPTVMRYRDLLKRTAIGCLTVMLDRTQVGPVVFPALATNQDLALWLTILKRGIPAHGLPEVLATYRVVKTSNTANKLRSARNVWRIYREVEHLSLPLAAWCFSHYAMNAARKHRASGTLSRSARNI